MDIYPCLNYEVCHNANTKPNQLCDDCKRAAKQLDREVKQEQRLERQQVVYKNDGLRRHR